MSTANMLLSYELCCPPGERTSVQAFAHRLLARFRRWGTRRRDLRQLRNATDHHLEDIGIRRSEIRSVVYGESADHARRLVLTRNY